MDREMHKNRKGERERERWDRRFKLFNMFFVKGETENYENTCKFGIIMKKQNYTLNT